MAAYLNPGDSRAPRTVAWLVACALASTTSPALAGRVELSIGRSETLLPYQWTTVGFAEWIGDMRPWWKIQWAPAFALGYFAARPDVRDVRLDNDVWVGAAGARAYLWRRLFFGFEFATTAGKTDALSTPYEFVSSLGWQGDHWQLIARHISNGDFHEPNHGETMVLVGVAF
jgi:hypothetical protein